MRSLQIMAGSILCLLLLAASCTREDITFEAPSQLLRFSADTVFCDTVYSQVRSETYAVKVYNDEDRDVMIPEIALEGGAASPYRINVDGRSGSQFTNIPLRKKDSLYVFVEIAPVANAPEAIAEDRVYFSTPAGKQHVTLFSVVQDAEFFIETKTNPNILSNNTVWDNSKAKYIMGDLTLAEGKTLDIAAGTKIYFHKEGRLKIAKNAKLTVYGTLGNEVIFRGDRNDTRYDTIPKNWKGISAAQGALVKMNYARVFGGTRGLELQEATADLTNSIFHTHQEFGIYAVKSTLTASNLVMNNCGEADLGIFKGGTVSLTHCTLANYWDFNAALPGLSIYASNEYAGENGPEFGPLNLTIKNSIVYGKADNAIIFKSTSGQTFNTSIQYSLLKYGNNAGYTPDATNIKDKDPKFVNYFTHKMNLRVKDDSPAKGKGQYLPAYPFDITGLSRSNPPTIGAYQ